MKQKTTGTVVLLISVLLFLVLYSFTVELNRYLHSACIAPSGACPHAGSLPVQSYIGFTIVVIMGIYGLYLFFSGKKMQELETEGRACIEEALKGMQGDEKRVYEIIKANKGFVFQGELIRQTGFTKVKVSRILDSLETKGLLERKRRGMSNVIVLK